MFPLTPLATSAVPPRVSMDPLPMWSLAMGGIQSGTSRLAATRFGDVNQLKSLNRNIRPTTKSSPSGPKAGIRPFPNSVLSNRTIHPLLSIYLLASAKDGNRYRSCSNHRDSTCCYWRRRLRNAFIVFQLSFNLGFQHIKGHTRSGLPTNCSLFLVILGRPLGRDNSQRNSSTPISRKYSFFQRRMRG